MSKSKAYRLFFRQRGMTYPQAVVWGEEALAAALARQRPVVIHHEEAVLWKCGICKQRGPWTKTWRNMPSPGVDLVRPDWSREHVIVCSDECAEKHWPGRVGKPYGASDTEPSLGYGPRVQARLKARYAAFDLERKRQAALRDHRKLPMFHEGKGDGWCRWCGDPVSKPQRSWHVECKRIWLVHYDTWAQARFLRERDGPACKVEGCDAPGEEVDHVIPLWSLRHLPDLERLPYYGPTNLQLLCRHHHQVKTSREAGERARERVGKSDG